jgi:hypothetical protein
MSVDFSNNGLWIAIDCYRLTIGVVIIFLNNRSWISFYNITASISGIGRGDINGIIIVMAMTVAVSVAVSVAVIVGFQGKFWP